MSLLSFQSYCEDSPTEKSHNILHTFDTVTKHTRAEIPVIKTRLPIHSHILEKLDRFIALNKIPHIIFHGPSGTGKLTLVKEFLQKIYGGDKAKLKSLVMTVNCSHGKGIQFIRDDLKFFARTNIQTKSGTEFKSIVLLNAHHLTVDAQSALRRCIELFSYNTRFFIIVENKHKLLNPILSRFCDIYVPEYVENLHQYHLNRVFQFKQNMHDIISEKIANTRYTTTQLMDITNELYEMGVSCLDLMEWTKTQKTRWSEEAYANITMHFYTVKSQFRNEKLLMIYMLDCMFND
jgi:replication-associated recombination protein RarA